MDLLLRALFGGVVVSLFAIVGDVIKPISLGGTTTAAALRPAALAADGHPAWFPTSFALWWLREKL